MAKTILFSDNILNFIFASIVLPELWHAGQCRRHLLNVVVKEVEDLHVVQVGHGRRDLRDLVVRQRQPRDVGHLPEPWHLLQVDEVLVTEVYLSPGQTLGLVQGLADDLGRHGVA